jgi:hypothetical protein
MSVVAFEQVAALAKSLTRLEKIQLVEEVMATLKQELASNDSETHTNPRRSLRGLWANVTVSAEDIDEARREMWGNFPREDI